MKQKLLISASKFRTYIDINILQSRLTLHLCSAPSTKSLWRRSVITLSLTTFCAMAFEIKPSSCFRKNVIQTKHLFGKYGTLYYSWVWRVSALSSAGRADGNIDSQTAAAIISVYFTPHCATAVMIFSKELRGLLSTIAPTATSNLQSRNQPGCKWSELNSNWIIRKL